MKFDKELDIDLFVPESKQILVDYLCPLCGGVYKDPVLDSCGDVFCRSCFNTSMMYSSICPVKKKPFKDGFNLSTLEFINKILDKQKLYCKNRIKGCTWIDLLYNLDKHLANDCEKHTVACNNMSCEVKLCREDLKEHLINCDYRMTNCEDCNEEVAYILLNFHNNDCSKAKIICPQNCGTNIERWDLENHKKNSCYLSNIECIYSSYGCQIKTQRKNIEEHYSINMENHNLLVLKFLESFQKNFIGKIHNLEENVNGLNIKLASFLENETDQNVTRKRRRLISNSEKEQNDNEETSEIHEKSSIQAKIPRKSSPTSNQNNQSSSSQLKEKEINLSQEPVDLEENQHINSAIKNNNIITEDKNLREKRKNSNEMEKDSFNFDKVNTSSEITILGNKLKCTFTKKNQHLFAFIDNKINSRNISWKVTINRLALWIAIGVCEKHKVISNGFKFVNKLNKDFNHSCFLISSNSYTWNANNLEENNKKLKFIPSIQERDSVLLNYNSISKELRFTIGVHNIKLTKVESNDTIVPCVVMISNGDEITLDLI